MYIPLIPENANFTSLRGGVADEAIHKGIKQFQNWIASASPRKDV